MKMIITVELKQYIVITHIFYIVIYKFYYRQEPNLIILLLIHKYSEIAFNNAFVLFSIAICLSI